jgi:hypothetical protein
MPINLDFFLVGNAKGEVDGACVLMKQKIINIYIKPYCSKIESVTYVVTYLKYERNKYHITHLNA